MDNIKEIQDHAHTVQPLRVAFVDYEKAVDSVLVLQPQAIFPSFQKRGIEDVNMVIVESIFRRLNWENMIVSIDGEFFNKLRFADTVVTYSSAQGHHTNYNRFIVAKPQRQRAYDLAATEKCWKHGQIVERTHYLLLVAEVVGDRKTKSVAARSCSKCLTWTPNRKQSQIGLT